MLMKPDPEDIQRLIADSLRQLRSDLALPGLSETGPATALMGEGSDLDSMAIVHLIVDLEGRLQESYGRNWILADERALSRKRSPFRTIGDLSEFIIETTPEA
jgi:acyl carrier protein